MGQARQRDGGKTRGCELASAWAGALGQRELGRAEGKEQAEEAESEFPFSNFSYFIFLKTKFKHDQSQIQMGF